MISAAQVRATIAQIEKYNTAVNAFRVKYNALPGDMQQSTATQFGFNYPVGGRSGGQGRGDGNGVIQSYNYYNGLIAGGGYITGETAFFWEDLSANANLISDVFTTATDACSGYSNSDLSVYMPRAKLSGTNIFVTISTSNQVGSNLISSGSGGAAAGFYWLIEGATYVNCSSFGSVSTNVLVRQAQMMDAKIDDGLPTSGTVQTSYVTANYLAPTVTTAPNASPANGNSCYDSSTLQYALSQNGGKNATCALLIQGQF